MKEGERVTKEKEEINLFLMTDEEIKTANNLLEKKQPTEKEKGLLENLTEKRNTEKNNIIPEFSFRGILGLKGDKIADEQYNLAKKYFSKISNLSGKPPALYNLALYLEKLEGWNADPKNVENNFPETHREKRRASEELSTKIKEAKHSHFITDYKWNKFIKDEESGSTGHIDDTITNAIKKQRLIIQSFIPDHLIKSVIYLPSLAVDAINEVENYSKMNAKGRKIFINSLEKSQERVGLFDGILKKRSENLRIIPSQILH